MGRDDDPTERMTDMPELGELPRLSSAARYDVGAIIAKGGMGEVFAAIDKQLGRDVAVKRMRGTTSDQSMIRFFREAMIQGRLDHPAIVPVHELGVDAEGRPFFVMKIVDVCLAVEFAHTKGIVHRDLKSANIVLGDFGEVYVTRYSAKRTCRLNVAPPRNRRDYRPRCALKMS